MTERSRPSVDICMCTYRREYVADALASIGALDADGIDVRIIVADNDTEPSAQGLVERTAARLPFPVLYLHAPARNISIARNACLEAVTADFVAFVDDDEQVAPSWLRDLMAAARATAAAAVLGPVKAVYEAGAPGWLVNGDFHSAAPVYVRRSIQTGYTCNALIRWVEPFKGLRFDLALGRSGGEDTDFFYRLHDLGGTIASAPDAIVYEPVPPERARLAWLLRRRLRAGQTHGTRLVRSGAGRGASLALAASKAGYCLAMTALTMLSPVGWRRNFLRMTLHLGVLGGLLGSRQANLYGGDAGAPGR